MATDLRRCGHCGLTSHGFVCCGLLYAEAGEECPSDHSADLGAKPSALTRGQSGPPRPLRAQRTIKPRGAR